MLKSFRRLWVSHSVKSIVNHQSNSQTRNVDLPQRMRGGLTDTYSTLVDSRSCGIHGRSLGHAWLHRWVIDTLSHRRQCGEHGQYECQRGISSRILCPLRPPISHHSVCIISFRSSVTIETCLASVYGTHVPRRAHRRSRP